MAVNRLGGLLGNSTFQQLMVWQILGQLINSSLAPAWAGLQAEAFRIDQPIPIPVADAVDAFIKSHMSEAEAKAEAALSGISNARFSKLAESAGEPPGVAALLELWRRGEIPESGGGADGVSVEQGIREGRTKNKWIKPLKALKTALPSPETALQALLEGQTDEARARELYEQWGGDPRYFQLQFDTRGSAPTPLEAAEMARRKIIPWDGHGPGVVSYEQAFLEGPWRNKWLVPYKALADYIPPPRTVTAMVREGSLSDAEALDLFRAAGLTEHLAGAYLAAAHKTKTASDHELVKSDVLALYFDQLWSRDEAKAGLVSLNYSAENAEFLLDAADFRREKSLLDKAVAKVYSLYIGHKIAKPAAVASLDSLGVAKAARDHMLLTWDQERTINVKLLTPAEIASAANKGFLTPEQAFAELQQQGYTARDAGIYLGIHGVSAPAAPTGA